MAEDSSDNLVYLLELGTKYKDFLGQIRHWNNLKMATDANSIWIKDFMPGQLESIELKSIPFAKLYVSKDNLLFPRGSLVPGRKMPGFLWTPLERALPVELTGFNHNFFGINQQQSIQLSISDNVQKASVLLVDKRLAHDYIINAPAIRLQQLQWTLVNREQAFFFGEPLLPLNGQAFWQKDNFIFPMGYDLEFPLLSDIIRRQMTTNDFIWWVNQKQYSLIAKDKVKSLSIASWKHTLQNEMNI
jgi:MoxR-vWA-beta-propeller ternary system domain bpX2